MAMAPVVLVHGIQDDGTSFKPHVEKLAAGGRVVRTPNLLPADGSEGIEVLARQLAGHVGALCSELATTQVDLVGYSLGGMVARYFIQRLDGASRVRRLVTIASPHRGSLTAYGLRSRAGLELRPGSVLLADLASDWPDTAMRVPTTTLWTPLDLIVLPGWHATLDGATAIPIPAMRHAQMLHHPRTWQTVREVLELPEEPPEGLAIGPEPP